MRSYEEITEELAGVLDAAMRVPVDDLKLQGYADGAIGTLMWVLTGGEKDEN